MKDWEKLEAWICEQLKELDPSIRRTPGSGNGNISGDVCGLKNIGLHCEAKCYKKKNVWNIDWLIKCEEEIPLHSKKRAIVVTENKDGKKVVHLDAEDFFDMYKDAYYYRNPSANGL